MSAAAAAATDLVELTATAAPLETLHIPQLSHDARCLPDLGEALITQVARHHVHIGTGGHIALWGDATILGAGHAPAAL